MCPDDLTDSVVVAFLISWCNKYRFCLSRTDDAVLRLAADIISENTCFLESDN